MIILSSPGQLAQFLLLLAAATFFGGVLGWQRESLGKPAGLRTHILVSVGSAFIVATSARGGLTPEGLSRVIQGALTGIGFLGAGTILKGRNEEQIRGLTTAAGLWMTMAVGCATGLGLIWEGLVGSLLALAVLDALGRLEKRIEEQEK